MTYKEWIESIKKLIEGRIGETNEVWASVEHSSEFNVMSIYVGIPGGMIFWMSFDEVEFNKNNPKQRQNLARIRRLNMAEEIEDVANNLLKAAKKLKK